MVGGWVVRSAAKMAASLDARWVDDSAGRWVARWAADWVGQ